MITCIRFRNGCRWRGFSRNGTISEVSPDYPDNEPMKLPDRGFPETEYEIRVEQFQQRMKKNRCDAVILTTEPEVRYFSGFLTQFWLSPTRPWFLVIPGAGKPIAVIPEIGMSGMADTWIDDIRTWPSPCPGDDGVSLLLATLRSLPQQHGRVGMSLGPESCLRMPAEAFAQLRKGLVVEVVDMAGELQAQRMVKSPREIEKIRVICHLASEAFAQVPSHAHTGQTERNICRNLQLDLLQRGADSCHYLVAGSGPGGYHSIIMGPTDRTIEAGDILIIDTGSTWDGYYCDFDRNWAFGTADDVSRAAYRALWQATEAGFVMARPGVTTSDLWQAMQVVMDEFGCLDSGVGRLGHGLGMELTEPPSHTPNDGTVLEAGMVLTLEPGMMFAPGRQMVHEENIIINEEGAEWLTMRAPEELPVL